MECWHGGNTMHASVRCDLVFGIIWNLNASPAGEGDLDDGLPAAHGGRLRASLLQPRVPALRERQRQAAGLPPGVVVRATRLRRRRLLQIPAYAAHACIGSGAG